MVSIEDRAFDLFNDAITECELPEIIQPEEEEEKCLHVDTIKEADTILCLECGVELEKDVVHGKEWRYYTGRGTDPNRVQSRRMDDKSIYADVQNMPFSDKVIAQANELFLQVTKGQIYRGNSRKSIICACIFHSYKKLEKPHTQDELIRIFGLNRKTSLKGMKFVSQRAAKDSFVHTTHITPVDLIIDIMDRFGATAGQKKEVIELYQKIHNRSFKLNGARPQSCSAGCVFFWIQKTELPITLKDFAKKVGLSELTILKITKEIGIILDNLEA